MEAPSGLPDHICWCFRGSLGSDTGLEKTVLLKAVQDICCCEHSCMSSLLVAIRLHPPSPSAICFPLITKPGCSQVEEEPNPSDPVELAVF